jgi:hypothetical protein
LKPEKWMVLAVGAFTALGWLLRAWPFLTFGNLWRVPVDYDTGVYFSAAALLARGILPYRDFTLVHPPGIALFYLPVTLLADPATAFSIARWLTSLVGSLNIALSGSLAYRCAGPVAAVAAAGLYAFYPGVVVQERNIFIEPVLNMACLAMANVWLSHRLERQPSWALLAGLLLGFALLLKSWAALWALGCVASWPERRRETLVSLAIGIAFAAVLLVPFAIAAPRDLFEQTVLFHFRRPPDGIVPSSARLRPILSHHVEIAMMAAAGLIWQLLEATRSRTPVARCTRLFGVVWVFMLTSFLLSPTYWEQYNPALAPAETQLAGAFAANLFRVSAGHVWRRLAALLVLVVLAAHSFRFNFQTAYASTDEMVEVGQLIRQHVPSNACFLPFEAVWALAGDRLPDRPPLVDVYADMLLATQRAGLRFPGLQQTLHASPAQERIRWLLNGCDYLVLGPRGHSQLTEETLQQIDERYTRLDEVSRFDLWQRRR